MFNDFQRHIILLFSEYHKYFIVFHGIGITFASGRGKYNFHKSKTYDRSTDRTVPLSIGLKVIGTEYSR